MARLFESSGFVLVDMPSSSDGRWIAAHVNGEWRYPWRYEFETATADDPLHGSGSVVAFAVILHFDRDEAAEVRVDLEVAGAGVRVEHPAEGLTIIKGGTTGKADRVRSAPGVVITRTGAP